MLKLYFVLLLASVLFFTSCKKDPENSPPVIGEEYPEKKLAGTYEGYKFFNKSKTDSLPVTLEVEWISDKNLHIEEITPFKNVKEVKMNGMNFTYDRGLGEDDCGRISMTGTGTFKGTSLYVIETSTCVRGNGKEKFVEYLVKKI